MYRSFMYGMPDIGDVAPPEGYDVPYGMLLPKNVDGLLDNRALASAAWGPEAGNHTVEARILEAAGSTVLDARGECEWFVGN